MNVIIFLQSYLPRFLEHSKELVGKERLPSKISGCIITSGFYDGNQKIMFYINHDQFGKISVDIDRFIIYAFNL